MAAPRSGTPLWRSQTLTRTGASPATAGVRSRLLLLLAALGVAALAVGLITWLRPAPRPDFLPLWFLGDRSAAAFPWAEQDRAALRDGGFFADRGPQTEYRPDAAALLQQFDVLHQSHDAVVVYLSGPAVSSGGQIYLLPADASPDDPTTWLPLRQILTRLRDCPSRNKLLVLDIMAPFARLDALDPPGQSGVLTNEVAAAVPAELMAVEDAGRLVLSACGPGETALVSEDLGRSVFNFYLEEGLRGWADGYGPEGRRDGLVTVHELAAFCRARVDRWARRNRNTRQSPTLHGDGPDFALIALEHGQPAAMPDMPEPRSYPEWLFKAWKEHDTWRAGQHIRSAPRPFRKLEAEILLAERAWRGGGDADRIQDRQLGRLPLYRRQLEIQGKMPRPQPASLALAAALGEKTDDSLVVALRDLLVRVKQQTQGLKADEAEKARAGLLGDFREKALAKASDFAVAWAVFAAAASDAAPQPESLRLLDRLLRARQPRPQYVETLLLRDLAESPTAWLPETVHHGLRAAALTEKAASHPEAFPFLAGSVAEAFQKAHDGQVRFWATGYASPKDAGDLLSAAAREAESLLPQQETLLKALAVRDEALTWLPAYLGYLEVRPQYEKLWLSAVGATRKLSDLLDPRSPSFADLQEVVPRLALDLESLRQPFDAERVKRLIQSGRQDPPEATLFAEAEALLATPLLDAETRKALWAASRQMGRRLNELTRQLDREENETRQFTPAPGEYDRRTAEAAERERGLRRARASLALLQLGYSAAEPPGWLVKTEQLLSLSEKDKAPSPALAKQLRQAWRTEIPALMDSGKGLPLRARLSRIFPASRHLPSLDDAALPPEALLRRERARALYTWLAGHYRYAARDWANLRLPWPAEASPEIFFAEAAAAYQPAADPTAESYLQISGSPPGPDAEFALRLRAVGPLPPKEPTPLPVRLLLPDTDGFRVTPDAATVKIPPGESETALSVRVQPGTSGERLKPPRGFLAEAGFHGRHFHHKIPVPLPFPVEQVQFLVRAGPTEAGPPIPEIRLRPGKIRQSFFLFARNVTDQAKNVLIEVKDRNGIVKGSEVKLALGPGETQRVRLGPPLPMLPPVLPEFQGPILLRALDVDKKNAVLGERTIPVGVAAPREYVRVAARSFEPAGPKTGGKNKLTVKLEGVVPFPGPAIPVEMVLPPRRIPGLLAAKDGTFRGELPTAEKGPPPSLTLFAEGIQLDEAADEEGYFYLNVDGYDRAFVFRTTFARRGDATTPRPDGRPAIRVVTDRFALASSKWDVVLEVDNAPADASLEAAVGQFQGQQFQADLVQKLPGPRQTLIGCTPQGPDGAWVFEAVLRDWVVPLNISGIKGQRLVRARLLDAGGGVMQTVVQPIYSDATPPERVRFVEPPAQAKKGSRVALRATGVDPESGIQRVVFFLGRPQGDKVPDKTPTVEGTPNKGASSTWAVAFPLPDVKGPTDVSVQFVNGVGLSRFETTSIELLDTDPRITGPGKIQGTVVEGPRPQAGLEVTLKGPKGNALAKTKTGPDGVFVFAPVAPGTYVVYSEKPESQRRGSKATKVEANKTAEVTVELELP